MSISKENQHNMGASVSLYNNLHATKSSENDEIDLLELASVLLNNMWWIVAAALVSAMVVFIFTRYFITPTYRATGSIYVVSSKDSVVNLSDLQIGNYLASDYEEVVYTWEVLQQTRHNLNLDYSYEELCDMLLVNNPANTRILELSVDSRYPQEAATIVNELMNVVSSYVVNVMETEKPNILSKAQVPTKQHSPSITRNTMLGALAGGFVCVLVIFTLFILDDKVKTPEDALKYTGLHTLAIIPRSKQK